MRDDRQRLEDILEAANFVLDFTRNRNKEALAKDQLLQSAVLHQLHVIGEAVNRLTDAIKQKYPELPWAAIYGFRNRIAHEYFKLDIDLVWTTVQSDIPQLTKGIAEIIRSEFSS